MPAHVYRREQARCMHADSLGTRVCNCSCAHSMRTPSNTPPCEAHWRQCAYPMMRFRNAVKGAGASGFVKKSAKLSAEQTKGTVMRPSSTSSRM